MKYKEGLVTYENFVRRAAQCTVGVKPEGKNLDFYNIAVNITKEDMDKYKIERDRKALFLNLGVIRQLEDKIDSTITRYFDTFLQAMYFLSDGEYDYMDEVDEEIKSRLEENNQIISQQLKDLEARETKMGSNFEECKREAAKITFKKNKHIQYLFIAENFTKEIGISYIVNGDQKQMCWDLDYPCDYIKTMVLNFRINLYHVSGGMYDFLRPDERKKMFPDVRKKNNNPKKKVKKDEGIQLHPRKII